MLSRTKKKPHAEIKLFCFPYAGGNSSTYKPWADHLPVNIELIIIQPPGRENRLFHPIYHDMNALVSAIVKVILPHLNKPYIFLGHSLGALVAFEVLNKLQKLGYTLPIHFIASGCRAPNKRHEKEGIHHLPDSEFIAELELLNGTPKAILENNELMKLFLPLLRVDFKIAYSYCFTGKVTFDCPISVFGGKDDKEVELSTLKNWSDFFVKNANVHILNGNHFFIDNNMPSVLQKLKLIFNQHLAALSAVNHSNK